MRLKFVIRVTFVELNEISVTRWLDYYSIFGHLQQ